MKKDKLLEEFKQMQVSDPQEIIGGLNKLVPYDTHYTSVRSTCNSSGVVVSTDRIDDVDTDYWEDVQPPIGVIVNPSDTLR